MQKQRQYVILLNRVLDFLTDCKSKVGDLIVDVVVRRALWLSRVQVCADPRSKSSWHTSSMKAELYVIPWTRRSSHFVSVLIGQWSLQWHKDLLLSLAYANLIDIAVPRKHSFLKNWAEGTSRKKLCRQTKFCIGNFPSRYEAQCICELTRRTDTQITLDLCLAYSDHT